jgi:carboxyl-terminal processing protease
VQQIIDLGDGSGLKLTVSRYFTPGHRSIQDSGITPDVPVAEAESTPAAGSPLVAVPAVATPADGPTLTTAARRDAAPRSGAAPDTALDAALAYLDSRARLRLP